MMRGRLKVMLLLGGCALLYLLFSSQHQSPPSVRSPKHLFSAPSISNRQLSPGYTKNTHTTAAFFRKQVMPSHRLRVLSEQLIIGEHEGVMEVRLPPDKYPKGRMPTAAELAHAAGLPGRIIDATAPVSYKHPSVSDATLEKIRQKQYEKESSDPDLFIAQQLYDLEKKEIKRAERNGEIDEAEMRERRLELDSRMRPILGKSLKTKHLKYLQKKQNDKLEADSDG